MSPQNAHLALISATLPSGCVHPASPTAPDDGACCGPGSHQILHHNVTVALEARSLGHRFSRRDDLLFVNHQRRRLAPLLRPRPFALPQSALLPACSLIQLAGLESWSLLL